LLIPEVFNQWYFLDAVLSDRNAAVIKHCQPHFLPSLMSADCMTLNKRGLGKLGANQMRASDLSDTIFVLSSMFHFVAFFFSTQNLLANGSNSSTRRHSSTEPHLESGCNRLRPTVAQVSCYATRGHMRWSKHLRRAWWLQIRPYDTNISQLKVQKLYRQCMPSSWKYLSPH
jgi:hypothetical protein